LLGLQFQAAAPCLGSFPTPRGRALAKGAAVQDTAKPLGAVAAPPKTIGFFGTVGDMPGVNEQGQVSVPPQTLPDRRYKNGTKLFVSLQVINL